MIFALCLGIAVTIPDFKSLQTNPGNPNVKTARLRHCTADQADFKKRLIFKKLHFYIK